jgi:hypothetical protein
MMRKDLALPVCANLCETVFVCTKFDDKNALVIEDGVNVAQVSTGSMQQQKYARQTLRNSPLFFFRTFLLSNRGQDETNRSYSRGVCRT